VCWLLSHYGCCIIVAAASSWLLHHRGCCIIMAAVSSWLLHHPGCCLIVAAVPSWLLYRGCCIVAGKFNPNDNVWEQMANSPHEGFRGNWPMAWPELGGGGPLSLKLVIM
jgi:hypothetical protein